MNKIDYITAVLEKFIKTFIIKYEYYNIGIIKKIRIDSRKNLEYDEKKWCDYFLKKSCLNYCAKFMFLRLYEDKGFITSKLNRKGLVVWESFVKNIKERYDILYNLAVTDIINNDEVEDIFRETDYDMYKIDNELAHIIINGFLDVDFSRIEDEDLKEVFRNIYPLDEREEKNFSEFYLSAPAFDYILSL
ncbi:hypothetical protein SAMN02745883_00509 [Caminicella sporogenes DSM 14501]|uniref:Uncharacterized protein n=1 Tax=Caminicella sporogenes DSM 14501 TaxID=1121266 RepID=A0A1M6MEI1_9FIRM|nr:hypothetical protein [Caminicella sporogenes]RKD27582.1 hypothetical protein BET04_00490 [Caminicella sporogenes]WIF94832.1 hypothetical protein QNI18_11305 [Caminicella sporogenes]SHJ81854.1 hypothetical protein SAMN02745883_00509 [Caminicella sporogenes DSM 14501]